MFEVKVQRRVYLCFKDAPTPHVCKAGFPDILPEQQTVAAIHKLCHSIKDKTAKGKDFECLNILCLLIQN